MGSKSSQKPCHLLLCVSIVFDLFICRVMFYDYLSYLEIIKCLGFRWLWHRHLFVLNIQCSVGLLELLSECWVSECKSDLNEWVNDTRLCIWILLRFRIWVLSQGSRIFARNRVFICPRSLISLPHLSPRRSPSERHPQGAGLEWVILLFQVGSDVSVPWNFSACIPWAFPGKLSWGDPYVHVGGSA